MGGTTIRTGELDIEGGNGKAATWRESGVVPFIQSTEPPVAAQPPSKSVVATIIAAPEARRLTIGEHGGKRGARVSATAVI